MNTDNDLVNLLKNFEHKGWAPSKPASEQEITSIETKLNLQFSESYRKLLLYSNGGELRIKEAFINLFDTCYLNELNPDPVWSIGLPDMVFFGDDQAGYLYYFDPHNNLKHGSWSVYGVSMGSANFRRSMYLAKNINCLFEKLLRGEDVLNRPYISDEKI